MVSIYSNYFDAQVSKLENAQVSKLENRASIKNWLEYKSNCVKIVYFYFCDHSLLHCKKMVIIIATPINLEMMWPVN